MFQATCVCLNYFVTIASNRFLDPCPTFGCLEEDRPRFACSKPIAHKPDILSLIAGGCGAEGEVLGNGVDGGNHRTPLPHHKESLVCE